MCTFRYCIPKVRTVSANVHLKKLKYSREMFAEPVYFIKNGLHICKGKLS